MELIYALRSCECSLSEIATLYYPAYGEISNDTIFKILQGLIYTDPNLRPDNYFENAHLRFYSQRAELIANV